MYQTLSILKENLRLRMSQFQRLNEKPQKIQKDLLVMEQVKKALERDLTRYSKYGREVSVFEVTFFISKGDGLFSPAKIWYSDVKEDEIEELVRRDTKNFLVKEIKVQLIKLGTIIYK